MKLHGKKPSRPEPVIVAIPRDEGDLVFICEAVLSYDEFDKICPAPKPKIQTNVKTGVKTHLFDDPGYLDAMKKHNQRHTDFTIATSLKNTPGLEWETVDYNDPDTWCLLEQELLDSGLTPAESGAISQGVFKANSVDEDKMEEARKAFTRSQEELPGI